MEPELGEGQSYIKITPLLLTGGHNIATTGWDKRPAEEFPLTLGWVMEETVVHSHF
jgi:hypothetical protein